jgi:hypothetical protein
MFVIDRFFVACGLDFKKDKWIFLSVVNTADIEKFVMWLRELHQNPSGLAFMCRNIIRHHMSLVSGDRDIRPLIATLPVPTKIRAFLNLEGEVAELTSDANL